MIIHKCDKCGKTAEQRKNTSGRNTPKDWYDLQFSGNHSYDLYQYDICPDCRNNLGLNSGFSDKDTRTAGEQLLEIIGEIVAEEVQNCQP